MSTTLHALCDRAIIQAAQQPPPTPAHSRMVLATTVLASSLAFIDGSVVNVGLPAIATSLSARGVGLSWVVNGYLLPLSALLLIGGAVGDVFGRRRLLILGVGMFILASAMCAAAPNLPLLIAGRALQGIGAAMLMPNSLAILGAAFKNEDRGRAIGIWAAVGAAAGAAGPLLGGWLIDVVGWRSIFFINLPIGAASIVLAARYLDDDPVKTQPPLDVLGAGLIATALLALTWGLTVASDQKGVSVGTACVLGAGGLLFVGFLYVEKTRDEGAMMPLSLFGSPSFIGLTLLTLLLYGALGGLLLLIPYVLIGVRGYSAAMAGAALLPLPLVIALSSSQMGKLAVRTGARAPLSIGAIIVAVGCVLATRIGIEGSYWATTFPAVLTISLGMGAAVAPLTTAVLASVETKRSGVASGLNSAVARTGGLIATAVASVVLGAHGTVLVSAYQIACLVAAGAAVISGLCAFLWVRVPGTRNA
jgi:EmrB/QacA subfamily drug resistance transporter